MGEDKRLPRLPDSEIAALQFEIERTNAPKPPPEAPTEEGEE